MTSRGVSIRGQHCFHPKPAPHVSFRAGPEHQNGRAEDQQAGQRPQTPHLHRLDELLPRMLKLFPFPSQVGLDGDGVQKMADVETGWFPLTVDGSEIQKSNRMMQFPCKYLPMVSKRCRIVSIHSIIHCPQHTWDSGGCVPNVISVLPYMAVNIDHGSWGAKTGKVNFPPAGMHETLEEWDTPPTNWCGALSHEGET